MHIRTFNGSADDMSNAIIEAEEAAQHLLDSLRAGELFSVTAQSFVDRFIDHDVSHHTCFHIITVVYE